MLSKGSVWAAVEEEFSASIPLSYTRKSYTGRTEREYEVVVLGRSFKISPKAFQPFSYYDKIEHSWDLTLSRDLVLPFSVTVRQCSEYQPAQGTLDRTGAEEYLRSLLENRLAEAMGEGGSVLDQQWETAEQDGVLTLTVTARCREQIARSNFNTED